MSVAKHSADQMTENNAPDDEYINKLSGLTSVDIVDGGVINIPREKLPTKEPARCKCMTKDAAPSVKRTDLNGNQVNDEHGAHQNCEGGDDEGPTGAKYVNEIIERVLHAPPAYAEYLLEHDDHYLAGLFAWNKFDIFNYYRKYHSNRLEAVYSFGVLGFLLLSQTAMVMQGGNVWYLMRNGALTTLVYRLRWFLIRESQLLVRSAISLVYQNNDEKVMETQEQPVSLPIGDYNEPSRLMLSKFTGKTILILGGCSELGRAVTASIACAMNQVEDGSKVIATYDSLEEYELFFEYLAYLYRQRRCGQYSDFKSKDVVDNDKADSDEFDEGFKLFMNKITVIQVNGLDMTRVVNFCQQIIAKLDKIDLMINCLFLNDTGSSSKYDLMDGWLDANFMRYIFVPILIAKKLAPLLERGCFESNLEGAGLYINAVSSDIAFLGDRGAYPFVNWRHFLHGLVVSNHNSERIPGSVMNLAISAAKCHFANYMTQTLTHNSSVVYGVVVLDICHADSASVVTDHLLSNMPETSHSGMFGARELIKCLTQNFTTKQFYSVPGIKNYADMHIDAAFDGEGIQMEDREGYLPPPLMMSGTLGMELMDLCQHLLAGYEHILKDYHEPNVTASERGSNDTDLYRPYFTLYDHTNLNEATAGKDLAQ